jgi:DNA-binding MarR family transcriptional regulator
MSKHERKSGQHKSRKIAQQAEQIAADLNAIRRALRKPLEAEIAKGELTAPQTAVMRVVVRQPGVILKDLSREVGLAHSTVSGIADRLEKRGLLRRKTDPEDARTTRIHPTSAVSDFVRHRMPQLSQGPLESALDRATKEERAAIGEALERLRKLLEAS